MDWEGVEPLTGTPLPLLNYDNIHNAMLQSQFCSRLAASGRVVLAVEHRDGTGTVSMPRSWHVDGNKSEPRTLLYIREGDIQYVAQKIH